MQKAALWYARWLTTPFAGGSVPPILYIFIFCPLAVLVVFTYCGPYCGPYYAVWWQGTPLDSSLYGINKAGRAFSQPLRPFITVGSWILAAAVPLLLSAIAFQIGWLGHAVRDGEGENNG